MVCQYFSFKLVNVNVLLLLFFFSFFVHHLVAAALVVHAMEVYKCRIRVMFIFKFMKLVLA